MIRLLREAVGLLEQLEFPLQGWPHCLGSEEDGGTCTCQQLEDWLDKVKRVLKEEEMGTVRRAPIENLTLEELADRLRRIGIVVTIDAGGPPGTFSIQIEPGKIQVPECDAHDDIRLIDLVRRLDELGYVLESKPYHGKGVQ